VHTTRKPSCAPWCLIVFSFLRLSVSGKSTLLRRIANGQIGGWPAHLKCCLVQQEVESSSATVMESVLASDLERVRLLALEKSLLQSKTPAAEASLNEVYEQLAAIDSDGAEARASEALDELGFTTEMQQQPTNTLSGGWRMRCAIASAMFLSPDVLLLDEPTNHLDVKTVVWLTEYVNSLDITCVIVSHDARFLSDTTTDTIHFHMQSLRYYPTNFDGFLQTRSEQAMNIARQQETLDAKREHIRASIDKVKKQAKKSGHGEMKLGMVASRQKKLGRMGFEKTASGQKFNAQSHGRRIGCENSSSISTEGKRVAMSQIEPPDADFRFSFPEPDMGKIPDGAGLVVMLDVAFGHGLDEAQVERLKAEAREEKNSERVAILGGHVPPVPGPNAASEAFLFANVDFTLRAGQKVGLLGQNGLGKSSLLGLLSGQLPPSRGVVNRHDGVRIGLFEQHLVDALDLTLTPVQHLLLVAPYLKDGGNAEQNARAALGRFGLGSKLALQPIGVLSGGQKVRQQEEARAHLDSRGSDHFVASFVILFRLALFSLSLPPWLPI
jgi:ATP-binding cassette subfamily F protein 3